MQKSKINTIQKRYYSQKRKSIFRQKWFWDLVLILIFFGSLSYLLLKTPYFEIKNIEIGTEENEIVQKIKELIDHRNFFLLDKANISKEIEKTFPQVREVFIKKKFPNSISVQFQKREEFGIFCLEVKNNSCFSISDDGVIFQEIPKEENKFLIVDPEITEVNLGEEVIQEDIMKNIKFLKEELQKFQIPVKEVEISSLEIIARTEPGFSIYFSQNNPFEIQMEALLGVLNNTLSKEDQANLKCCIDLRGVTSADQIGVVYIK
ncbi:MAG TPA: FtsQ-type POTRA domain-containing protein [Candidatus Pacearchaeota archaeon]|mgnify:CR=1 FL=1|nr:FtsQ-type POTRA domain-containing protein [Candidatus Pacearchaeota archaeon]HOK94294.1 FtsQ-type POTRA domain-containing protein [Candidatus Pacearchaeota archaeon]HPO75430.1 FtsQ-type POTRA domain-containing protein [Candidatus Pacearchaeota archaeon]